VRHAYRAACSLVLALAVLVAVTALIVPAPQSSRSASAAARAGGDAWIGRPAPPFELSTLDGRRIRLNEFRGRVVLVNFWAIWCAPCRVEMPWLTEFDTRYHAQGLTVLGVSVDDGGRERIESFVRERHVGYPILLKDADVDLRYGGVRFLPQTFFVSRDGTVINRVYGIRTRADFEADIRSALGLR
jgi:thiol-disulfide isomerase/thioredoxin